MSEQQINPANSPQSALQPRPGIANEPEVPLWHGGYSPKAMVGTWIVSIFISAAVLVALILIPIAETTKLTDGQVWGAGIGIIVLWWLLAGLSYAYKRIGTYYELTSQRFIHSSGILLRTTDRIDVIDIDDVTFSQGIVDRMLGIGTIKLSSQDATHPQLVLKGIDEVNKVSGMIDDTRRKERRKRSLHIDAG
jgi:uncharacterized membrane protein YdbT with pleckstrin-like domain